MVGIGKEEKVWNRVWNNEWERELS